MLIESAQHSLVKEGLQYGTLKKEPKWLPWGARSQL